MAMAVCDCCGSKFTSTSNLYRHIRRVHKNLECSFKTEPRKEKFPCNKCTSIFNCRQTLYRHRKKNHEQDVKRIRKSNAANTAPKVKLLPECDLQALLLRIDGVNLRLPEGYRYKELKRNTRQKTDFFVEFEFALTDSEEAIAQWMTELKEINKIFFRKEVMITKKKETVVYKKRFRCGHNVKTNKNRITASINPKQTYCPFHLNVAVCKKESKYTAKIGIIGKHNHVIGGAISLKYREVSKDVKDKMLRLFSNGLGPAKAYQEHLKDLKNDYGADFDKIQGDRYLCPDMHWVYYFHDKTFKKNYGPQRGKEMLNVLKEKIEEFNSGVPTGTGGACLKIIDENNYVLSLVTPFMLRVHEHFSVTSEIAFVDSTRTVDLLNCKVFLILTNSYVGALPLGVIITSSGTSDDFSEGLTMFKSLLSENSFGGRGNQGPQIFMMDDSSVQRVPLNQNFPEATLLLCEFHTLLSFWRYIHDDTSGIESWYRADLFNQFKRLLNASNSVELQKKFEEMLLDDVVKNNSNLVSYIVKLCNTREEWAKYFRANTMALGQYMTDITEASMRVLKDPVTRRFKVYSPVHLFQMLTTDFETHFIDKLVDISNGVIPSYLKKREMQVKKKCTGLQNNGNGKVTNTKKNQTFDVNTVEYLCTCPDGANGHLCEHLYFILKRSPHDPPILIPENQDERKLLFYIATGNEFSTKDTLQPSHHLPVNEDMQIEESTLAVLNLNNLENNSNYLDVNKETQEDKSPVENFYWNEPENDSNELLMSEEVVEVEESPLESDVDRALADFKMVCESIMRKVTENRCLLPALRKMIENYSKIRTVSELKFALSTFGECDDNPKKTRQKERKSRL